MNVVAIICARGGSKGVPRKNIRLLRGKPLIVHTIEVAGKCKLIDRVIVSTDDPEIAKIASVNGAEIPFMRPKELALDNAPKLPVLEHAIHFLESKLAYFPDIIVDLDPTSPLRTEKDIENCIRMVEEEGVDNVFSVTEARRNPYFNMVEIINNKVQLVKKPTRPLSGRQEAPRVYDMNASIYVWKRDALMNNVSIFLEHTKVYIMPKWAMDIDNETDFEFVEFILKKEGCMNVKKF